MVHEMLDGSCDGKYKRFAPDRTNVQLPDESKIRRDREELYWPEGVCESSDKTTVDGRFVQK
jgi:hypothetical protein